MTELAVVVAPDSFKGSVDAATAAAQIAAGWRDVRPQDRVDELPMADGGEGTLDAIAAAIPDVQRVSATVEGPDGHPVVADWLLAPDGTAVVEIAQTSGLTQSDLSSPLTASTVGLGQLVRHALDHPGTRRITVCLGGSATTDGGTGALTALGLRLTDATGTPVGSGGAGLIHLADVDASSLRRGPAGGVECLVDVTSPLLGEHGAAATFGPQKGASASDVAQLERGLEQFASIAGGAPDQPGAGAAGGTAYGLATFLGAQFTRGAVAVGRLYDLTARLAAADVVVTGEGRFDDQSLRGKVVGHVLECCAGSSAEVAVVAGQVATTDPRIGRRLSLTDLAGSADRAMTDPERYLRLAGRNLAASRWRADHAAPAQR